MDGDLEEGDYLVGVEVVGKEGLILSISENGFGKRTPLKDYRLTARGRKGVINADEDHRSRGQGGGDHFRFKEDSDLMIITPARADHPASIRAESARRAGSTQGVKVK